MVFEDERATAHERFNQEELREWPEGSRGALQRYTWAHWYRLSGRQFDRLLAEASSDETHESRDRAIGGLPKLALRMQNVFKAIDFLPPSLTLGAKKASEERKKPIRALAELGQLVCDIGSRDRVAAVVKSDFPYGARVLLLGDDDLVCESLADEGYDVNVIDVDSRLADTVNAIPGTSFHLRDIREPLPDFRDFDAVLLDPADGSVALTHWLSRAHECLSNEDGSRVYLSVNLWRLGKRWPSVIRSMSQHQLAPVAHMPNLKIYPSESGSAASTDLWVFERLHEPSSLPLPYLEIETFR